MRERPSRTRHYISKLYTIAIFILIIYSASVTYLYYKGVGRVPAGANSVQLNILESPTLIQHLSISVYNNESVSRVMITVPPANYTYSNRTSIAYTNVAGSNSTYQNSYYTTVFGGLYPYTTYTIFINGSEQPYCRAGQICPDYILAVHRTFNITTGAPSSTNNLTLNV